MSCRYYGNEILIIKKLFIIFHYYIIPHAFLNVNSYRNEFCEENKMIEGELAYTIKTVKIFSYQNYINFSISFSPLAIKDDKEMEWRTTRDTWCPVSKSLSLKGIWGVYPLCSILKH